MNDAYTAEGGTLGVKMNGIHDRLKKNKGETMVEVMVAFIVLLLVLALFGNSIAATGDAGNYARDKRIEYDTAMQQLQKTLYNGGSGCVTTGARVDSSVTGVGYSVTARQYRCTESGCIYWVFE
ncbi:MAG: type II secretion system GspH family protein [Lachnospiraceae bacterium]|nr:type II secretion system GspH family protein [Lachnospiraceae bacterium]